MNANEIPITKSNQNRNKKQNGGKKKAARRVFCCVEFSYVELSYVDFTYVEFSTASSFPRRVFLRRVFLRRVYLEPTFQLKWTDLFEQYGEGFVIRKFITHSVPTFLENLPPKRRQISTVNLFH